MTYREVDYFKDGFGNIFPRKPELTCPLLSMTQEAIRNRGTGSGTRKEEKKIKKKKKKDNPYLQLPFHVFKCRARYFAYTLESLISSVPVNTDENWHRELKTLALGHRACKWKIWGLNPGLSGSHSVLL